MPPRFNAITRQFGFQIRYDKNGNPTLWRRTNQPTWDSGSPAEGRGLGSRLIRLCGKVLEKLGLGMRLIIKNLRPPHWEQVSISDELAQDLACLQAVGMSAEQIATALPNTIWWIYSDDLNVRFDEGTEGTRYTVTLWSEVFQSSELMEREIHQVLLRHWGPFLGATINFKILWDSDRPPQFQLTGPSSTAHRDVLKAVTSGAGTLQDLETWKSSVWDEGAYHLRVRSGASGAIIEVDTNRGSTLLLHDDKELLTKLQRHAGFLCGALQREYPVIWANR